MAKRSVSLKYYVFLEIFIGVYILSSPWLFSLFSDVFTSLAEIVDNRAILTFIRIVVTLTSLFIPAFCMGATFPAMISGAALDSAAGRTARTGYLYSINTLGAAVGCFIAGHRFLYEFGVRVTLNCAFALNIIAALCALMAVFTLVKTSQESSVAVASMAQKRIPLVDKSQKRFLSIATFAIGFVSLAYEILLMRMGILYLGNVVSVFALVLSGFLLGTGLSAVLGTWFYGVLDRHTKFSKNLFGLVALVAGGLVMVMPYVLLLQSGSLLKGRLMVLFGSLGIIAAPTIMIGALLPIAIRMLRPGGRDEATREASTLYALNTIGGLIGAAITNHYIVPIVGMQNVLIGLTLICASVGFYCVFNPGRSFLRWFAAVSCVVMLAAVPAASLPNLIDLYVGEIARKEGTREAKIRLVHEGRAATVAVIDHRDPKKGNYRDMYLNGIEEASTRYFHTQLFKLLGILPVMVHESEEPKEALVIAFGAGITAGSVLASDQVSSVEVVDLNPDIEGINNLFTKVNGDVFHKPRFHFINDDGRNFLVTNKKRYSVIINDSTHPRAYDSWILYTEEFFQAVKKRLLPGGVYAQWVPVEKNMRGYLFQIHLNTFKRVFPNSTFWYVYGSDQAFLLATPEPFTLNAQFLQERLDRLPEWFLADFYQMNTVDRIAGFFWMGEEGILKMIGGETRVNTDNKHYFDKGSALIPLPNQWQLPRFQGSILPYIQQADDTLRASIRKEQTVAQLLSRYEFFKSKYDLFRAYCTKPDNRNAQYWISHEFSGEVPPYEVICQQFR